MASYTKWYMLPCQISGICCCLCMAKTDNKPPKIEILKSHTHPLSDRGQIWPARVNQRKHSMPMCQISSELVYLVAPGGGQKSPYFTVFTTLSFCVDSSTTNITPISTSCCPCGPKNPQNRPLSMLPLKTYHKSLCHKQYF